MQVGSKISLTLLMQAEQNTSSQPVFHPNYNTFHLTDHCKHIDSCNYKNDTPLVMQTP